MKGQFFISGIVVIAVILIVSMNYANSAEELRIELGNDLAFDNYKNAYERAVPDDWEFVNYVGRNKIGVCVSATTYSNYVNFSDVKFTACGSVCSEKLKSSVTHVGVDETDEQTLMIKPSLTDAVFDDKNCTEFFIYSDGPDVIGSIPADESYAEANGTKFHYESIETSPGTHFLSNYRAKNIFVNEISVDSDGNYTVTYKSNQIDYTGEL